MIKFEDVQKTYTGKAKQCMCGCKGRYSIPTSADPDLDGYQVSDRSCKHTVRKLNELIDWENPDAVASAVSRYQDVTIVFAETNTRAYTAYLVPTAKLTD
jgi:hypothetical protein